MYFENVHVLRAIAALSVVVYHIIELLPWKDFPIKPTPLLWFRMGWLGVDLFFVISGFVIALSAIRLSREAERPFIATYVRHRAARIMPLYFLTGAVFLFFSPASYGLLHCPRLGIHLATHCLFIHNLFLETHGSINGANWSVGTEVQFYLLILLTARWLSRANPWLVLGGCLAVTWAWRGLVFWMVGVSGGGSFLMFMYSTQLFGMLDLFGFGIFLSRLVLDGVPLPARFAQSALWQLVLAWRSLFWLVFAVVAFWIAWSTFWPRAQYWDFWQMVVFWRTLAGLAFFAIVGAAVFVRMPPLVDRYLLSPIRYLGEISYGIYLWHLPVLLCLKEQGISQPLPFTLLTLGGVLLCAAASWHLMERPIINRFR